MANRSALRWTLYWTIKCSTLTFDSEALHLYRLTTQKQQWQETLLLKGGNLEQDQTDMGDPPADGQGSLVLACVRLQSASCTCLSRCPERFILS